MQQTNDLNTSQSTDSQNRATHLATTRIDSELVEFLASLPSLNLSATRRISVYRRFDVTNDELATAMAICVANKRRAQLPTPARAFGADTLTYAIALTGTTSPTPAQLDAALLKMYPVGGPTAARLVAAGWLLLNINKELPGGMVEVTQQPELGN